MQNQLFTNSMTAKKVIIDLNAVCASI